MDELEYQEEKIKKLLSEMTSIFSDIESMQLLQGNQDRELEYQLIEFEENFKYWAHRVYILCIAYLEKKGHFILLNKFELEVIPFFKEDALFKGSWDTVNSELNSDLITTYWKYLFSFPAFSSEDNEQLTKRTGLAYLEHILESTGVTIRELGRSPSTESQVYQSVRVVCKATFPNVQFPSQSFQTTAKCYIPDILVPSLNCAIEYKYADSEKRLIETIDQILIDVVGYNKHPLYKLFYAVFYTKPGIISRQRFKDIWQEKEFPDYWKGILVEGV
jgi:hypothetical protein